MLLAFYACGLLGQSHSRVFGLKLFPGEGRGPVLLAKKPLLQTNPSLKRCGETPKMKPVWAPAFAGEQNEFKFDSSRMLPSQLSTSFGQTKDPHDQWIIGCGWIGADGDFFAGNGTVNTVAGFLCDIAA
jgi:hypothetical protein